MLPPPFEFVPGGQPLLIDRQDHESGTCTCPHMPYATFRGAVVQMAYLDLYMHLIQDPADCKVAVALHAEQMDIVRVQAASTIYDAVVVASGSRVDMAITSAVKGMHTGTALLV